MILFDAKKFVTPRTYQLARAIMALATVVLI